MFEQLLSLNEVSINFNAGGVKILNIVLAIIMFGVALGIKPITFKEVFTKPKSIITGLFLQWIGLPAVTFLLIFLLKDHITPMVALGMILVASCPGGNISNFMSSFSKGNTELSVSMTTITTIFAAIITPLNFATWGYFYQKMLNNNMMEVPKISISFMNMFSEVIVLIGIPIILGLAFVKFFPNTTKKIIKPFQWASLAFFVFMVVIAFAQNFQIFIDHIFYIFIIVLIHNFLALSLGFSGASLMRLPRRDKRSISIEVGIQNSGLALVLLFNPTIFPQEGIGGMLFITAWWGVWHIVSGLTVSSIFRATKLT